jgi:hypothetical protein
MLRIMDVATALRQDRELVEEQLNLPELQARLRERMLAAAKVTGEDVTPEEVDAAIATYYASLHTFQEPKASFRVFLAHVWISREPILRWGTAATAGLLLTWWLFLSASGPFSAAGRSAREIDRLSLAAKRHEESIRAIALDSRAGDRLARLQAEAVTYREQKDAKRLAEVEASLAALENRLREEYTLSVVTDKNGKSGIDRYQGHANTQLSGFYLILAAQSADGRTLRRSIHNSENGKDEVVEQWGELVPADVYERLKHDKKADGILDETTFGAKKRGALDEEIVMKDGEGRPLKRTRQITKW